MNTEELTATVNALHGLCMAQQGKLAALETINGAIVAAVGTSLPPLVGLMSQNVNGLEPYFRDTLEPESLEAFDSTLASFQQNLRALSGQ